MVHVIASIRVKEGRLQEYATLFKENLPNVHAEEGCIEYVPCIDADTGWTHQQRDPCRLTVIEKWASMEALQAHSRAPHMVAFRGRAGHLVESMTLQVVGPA